jgi:16S rRNA (uracil1498-N3)-methyltransferase
MSVADRRRAPLVFVDDLEQPVLDEGDAHHLSRVLRLRTGGSVLLSNGVGSWRAAVMTDTLCPGDLQPIRTEDPRPQPLTVGFAVVKGDRSELVVQKLTELGIDRIIPFHGDRSVVRWDEKRAARNLDRHRRVAREAAMQARNVWVPTIESAQPLAAVLQRFPDAAMAEPGQPILGSPGSGAAPREVLIGPEGGFTAQELEGRLLVGLPGNILRAESAAIAAAVLLALTAPRG